MKSDLKEIELSRKNKTVEYACHCSPPSQASNVLPAALTSCVCRRRGTANLGCPGAVV
jgi:hypothetical protein